MNNRLVIYTLLVGAIIFLTSFDIQAQPRNLKIQSGIFLTAEDYQNGKLTLPNPSGKSYKIRLNDFWGSRYVEVVHEGQKYRFHKDSVYAYQDSKGKVFRFFKNYSNEYRILENKRLMIYSMEKPDTKAKGAKPVTFYFFSTALNEEIIPLTIENVKSAFPGNHWLHDELDKYFKRDQELIEYDYRHKAFRVNHALESIFSKTSDFFKTESRLCENSVNKKTDDTW